MAWVVPPGGTQNYINNPLFSDPVQGGNCSDCAYIAALSALAWTNPQNIAGNIGATQITFYNWAGRAMPWAFGANIWNAMNDATFCHSSGGNVLWPSYYEKAFVCCAQTLATGVDPIPGTYPAQFHAGAAVSDINKLTPVNWTPFGAWAGNFYTFLGNANLLSANAPYPGAAGLGGSSQQVIYPLLVADPGLAHVYTVLGTRTNANGTYIILRNPTAGGAPGGILLADPTWWVHYSYYANGAVLPVPAVAWRQIPIGANGVFGVSTATFMNYFSSYSIVHV